MKQLPILLLIVMSYSFLSEGNDKDDLISELANLKELKLEDDKKYQWKANRLKTYVKICFEQNKLIRPKKKHLKLVALELQLTEKVY